MGRDTGNRLDRNRNQGTENRNKFQHRTITNITREEGQNKVSIKYVKIKC